MLRNKRVNKRKSPPKSRRVRVRLGWQLPTINWRLLGNAGLIIGMGCGFYLATLWVLDRQINSVQIEGQFERVPATQIEAAITPYLIDGHLTADLQTVQRAITALPWVKRASVRRGWPSSLLVSVVEERAAAVWRGRGLLNVYGELFVESASHIPAELPNLSGPDGSELRVAERFFDLDALLEQRGLTATSLAMDERGAWQVGLSNGMHVRFGAVAVEERTARFFKALDSVLTPVIDQVNYIDMRYTNGFAIGWKPGSNIKLADQGELNPHV